MSLPRYDDIRALLHPRIPGEGLEMFQTHQEPAAYGVPSLVEGVTLAWRAASLFDGSAPADYTLTVLSHDPTPYTLGRIATVDVTVPGGPAFGCHVFTGTVDEDTVTRGPRLGLWRHALHLIDQHGAVGGNPLGVDLPVQNLADRWYDVSYTEVFTDGGPPLAASVLMPPAAASDSALDAARHIAAAAGVMLAPGYGGRLDWWQLPPTYGAGYEWWLDVVAPQGTRGRLVTLPPSILSDAPRQVTAAASPTHVAVTYEDTDGSAREMAWQTEAYPALPTHLSIDTHIRASGWPDVGRPWWAYVAACLIAARRGPQAVTLGDVSIVGDLPAATLEALTSHRDRGGLVLRIDPAPAGVPPFHVVTGVQLTIGPTLTARITLTLTPAAAYGARPLTFADFNRPDFDARGWRLNRPEAPNKLIDLACRRPPLA